MPPQPNKLLPLAKVAVGFVAILSSLALLAWLYDHQALGNLLPGIAGMTFNTALCFLLLSSLLYQRIHHIHQRWHILAIISIALFSSLSLLQDIFSIDLGLDQLFINSLADYANQKHPGRMSPVTSLGFIFAAAAFMSMHWLSESVRRTLLADLWVALLGGLSALGLAMNYYLTSSPNTFSHFSSISFFTALSFLAISVGLFHLLRIHKQQSGIKDFFYFGTHLMYRLSYPKKFLLISLIFAFPITILVMDKTQLLQQNVAKTELKIKGLEHIALLSKMLQAIPEHRGMSFSILHGAQYYKPALHGKALSIDALLQQQIALDEKNTPWARINEAPYDIRSRWQQIKMGQLSPERNWQLHTEIIALIHARITAVGHQAKLSYEGNETLNNLINLQLHDMPIIFELAGQLRGLGAGLLAKKQVTTDDKLILSQYISQLRLKLIEAQGEINLAFSGSQDFVAATALRNALLTYQQRTLKFLSMVERQFFKTTLPSIAMEAYFDRATSILTDGHTYFDQAQGFLQQQLQQRIVSLHREQYTVKFLIILLVLVMFYVFMAFYYSIVSMVVALEESAERMSRGDLQSLHDIPQFDEMGKVAHSFNKVADALHKSTLHIKAIVEHSVEGIVTTDAQANITSFNPAAAKLFGYTSAEVIGQNITILIPDSLKKKHLDKFSKFSTANPISSVLGATLELAGLRKGGTEFAMEMSLNAVTLDGEFIYLAMFRDVSTRQALEIQLRQAQKMEAVGVLAGGIAHNFNNMMMALTGRIYIAKKYLGRPEKVEEQLDLASATIHEAKEMVSQLLAFARKDFFVRKAKASLPDLLQKSFNMARLGLRSNVDIHLQLPSFDTWILCDISAIQQVIMNLINNANDAVADNSNNKEITVSLERYSYQSATQLTNITLKAGEYACITVRDNGCGIKATDMTQIFEPYFTTKAVGEGTGLGLSTSFGTVASHGGQIDVISKVGQGSSFKLYFPLEHQVTDSDIA